MLPDAESFLQWLDAKTEQAEAAKHANKIIDPLMSEQHRIRSLAFRIVAMELIKEQTTGMEMVNNPSLEPSPHTGAP